MATGNFVAYYRVSTKKQGDSGLGLEAQQEMVTRYLNGGEWKLVAEYTEIESGTRQGNDRPKLKEALAACKLYGAVLVIAKLDRLYRDMYMVSKLQESGVDFVCCDNPHMGKSMIQVTAVFAEMEADKISQRTKEALDAKKRRGEPTGASCWKDRSGVLSAENQEKGRSIAAASIKAKADEFAALVLPTINDIRTSNPSITAYGIAKELASKNIPTARGSHWTTQAVKNILARG
ncbi:MAG: recombinase family protein [Deltaproteobacteria bacterium]